MQFQNIVLCKVTESFNIIISTVHESKHKFHYEIIASINTCQFHKYGIGIYYSEFCRLENSFLISLQDCAKPEKG
jgi:hypothetical protein